VEKSHGACDGLDLRGPQFPPVAHVMVWISAARSFLPWHPGPKLQDAVKQVEIEVEVGRMDSLFARIVFL